MASPHFEALEVIASIREYARRGDWRTATELIAAMERQALPDTPCELGEYLRRLKEVLMVAKASRAQAAASLVRLNAAASFNDAALGTALDRHNFGDPANS